MDKYYHELVVTPTSQYYAVFIDIIAEIYTEAIEEKDGSIILRDDEPLDDVKWAIEHFAQSIEPTVSHSIVSMEYTKKENQDWISLYQNSIEPIAVDRFYIRPSWESKKEGFIDIIIDPALAFGSGHHESTSSIINCLSKYVTIDSKFLDVGCGSGILSLCAQKLGAQVDLCDTDEDAVSSARKNFEANGSTLKRSWVGSADSTQESYDIVVANIIADIIIIIANDLKKRTNPEGILILSGILDKYLQKVLKHFLEFEILECIEKNEWRTVVLKRK